MKLRKLTPIVMSLCALILGASAGFSQIKSFNAFANPDKASNALGFQEVPEMQGFGGVALLTVLGAVGYGARKVYQKIVSRNRQ